MSDKVPSPNWQDNEALLTELFEEVKKWEGTLAGGTTLAIGATTVESLLETKVSFGNPKQNLIALTPELFKNAGLELNWIRERHLPDKYDFYYLTLMVHLRPKPGAQFKALTCQIEFGPKGDAEPIVESIFPTSKWRPVINYGGGLSLGLDSNLAWTVGLDTGVVTNIIDVPAELKANVDNKNNLKAFITVPDYRYEIGRFEITALGEGGSDCYWRIEESDLQTMPQVQLAMVFKVPKGSKSITLRGAAWAEPSMAWLTANLRNVFSDLADRLQTLLKGREKSANQFARGAAEEWVLNLPQ